MLLTGLAVQQWSDLGHVGAPLTTAVALAALALAASPSAARGLRFHTGSRTASFHRGGTYARFVFLSYVVALLAVAFGRRSEIEERLAAHLAGVSAGHVLLLCRPALLQAAIDAVARNRVARAVDGMLGPLLLSAVLGEIVLRVALPQLPGFSSARDQVAFETRKLSRPLFGFPPNALGYNDSEFAKRRSERIRIAAIGDSFFVSQVPRPFGVVARTAELLAEARPEAPPELYNFGVVATGPSDYVEILDRDARAFAPDVVLVGFYVGNDTLLPRRFHPLEKYSYGWVRMISAASRLARARSAEVGGRYVNLAAIERVDREFWFGRGTLPPIQPRRDYVERAARAFVKLRPPDSALAVQEWNTALEALTALDEKARGSGARLAIAVLPDHAQLSPSLRDELRASHGIAAEPENPTYPQRRLAGFCSERGLTCLDLLPAFAAEPDPDRLFLPNDNHWSAPGNEAAARALAAWLDATLPRSARIRPRKAAPAESRAR